MPILCVQALGESGVRQLQAEGFLIRAQNHHNLHRGAYYTVCPICIIVVVVVVSFVNIMYCCKADSKDALSPW